MKKTLLICILFIVVSRADNPPIPGNYNCVSHKISKPIQIDGKIETGEWDTTAASHIGFEVNPGDNLPAKQKTEFYSAYDENNLYFAFKCYDTNPSAISAHKSDRDQIFNDDFVGIILDPFNDNQSAYELFVNPFGIQGDLMRTSNNEDASFDMVWKSAATITDYGYCVEMAIPFSSLRFPKTEIANWHLIALRIYPRDSRYNFSWTPMDRNNPCMMCQSGMLTGPQGIKSPVKVDLLPYIVSYKSGSVEDSDVPNSPFTTGKTMGRIGLGLKVTPNSNMVVEAVINPDFSQVEADAQQISVNSSFALFYSEKRPFFFEGSDLFNGRIIPFYSRMINSPSFATKVLGKSGSFSYATIFSYDKESPFIIPGEEQSDYESSARGSFSTIFRGKYSLGGESFVGSLLTSRNFKNAGNQMLGLDWSYLFMQNLYFRGQYYYSYTKELDAPDIYSDTRKLGHSGKTAAFDGESLNGSLLRLEFDRSARYHYFELDYYDVSPQFRSDLGYINRVDTRVIDVENGYNLYPENMIVTGGYVFVHGTMRFNHEHVQKERYIIAGLNLQLKSQTSINISYLPVNDELYKNAQFDNINRTSFNFFMRPDKMVSFDVYGDVGRFIKRDDTPRMGTGHNLGADLTLKLFDILQSSFSYSRFRLSDVATKELFYDGYILQNNTTVQVDNGIFFRLISAYNAFDHTINLYPLLSYKLNPFTLFYLGSSYDMQHYDEVHGFIQTQRQYFLKLQYLWSAI